MATLNPYLNFNGNAEEAFKFYKSVFGGEFSSIQRFKDTPEAGKVGPKEQDKLMHVALPIGKGNVLMASDVLESMGYKSSPGTNFYISVSADSEQEAARIFNGLSASGTIHMPLQKTFWNAYFGMLKDKFDVRWMVSFDYNQQK